MAESTSLGIFKRCLDAFLGVEWDWMVFWQGECHNGAFSSEDLPECGSDFISGGMKGE